MFNAVGGSTIPSDFRVRTLDAGDDWPCTDGEREPFDDLSDRITGVYGITGDPSQPPRSPRSTRPLPMGKLGTRVGGCCYRPRKNPP
jgi:hypothetical protein